MPSPEEQLEEIRKELQWINVKDDFNQENIPRVNTIYKILVPAGVLVTAGVLGTGIFYMMKRNSQKQQMYMRYRILAQGITVIVATLGIFHVKLSS